MLRKAHKPANVTDSWGQGASQLVPPPDIALLGHLEFFTFDGTQHYFIAMITVY